MVVRNAVIMASRIMMVRWGLYMYLEALFLCYEFPPNSVFKLKKNILTKTKLSLYYSTSHHIYYTSPHAFLCTSCHSSVIANVLMSPSMQSHHSSIIMNIIVNVRVTRVEYSRRFLS